MGPLLRLTLLASLGNGAVLYGLEYPGLSGCPSWCYLTIAKNVIIATQPEKNCGTSLTNIWCPEFIEVLTDLPPIRAAGEGTIARWFEHYDREENPTLHEVFIAEETGWKYHAEDEAIAQAREQLTGEAIPDFVASGFADEMLESVRGQRHTSASERLFGE
jgi:hypothetical protein